MAGLNVRAHREQRRNELGRFTDEFAEGTDEGALAVAEIIRDGAHSILAAHRYNFRVGFYVEGGGGSYDVVAVGQFAEMAEFGSPPHAIPAPAHGWLVNEATELPIPSPSGKRSTSHSPDPGFFSPKGGVAHPGTDDIHMLERAGDAAARVAAGIIISKLP